MELSLQTPITKSTRQLLDEAMQCHKMGRLDEAVLRYRQVFRIEPQNINVVRLLGLLRSQQGNFAEAERWYRKAVKIDAGSADAQIELGGVLRQLGRLAEAALSYRRAIELKPDYAGAHLNLGVALHELGQLDEAITCYRRLLAIQPRFIEAYYNLANTLSAAGRLDEAIANYRSAIAINPDYADAYNNLGAALQKAGRLAEAAVSYQQVVRIRPGDAEGYRNLGMVRLELGQLAEATAAYEKVFAIRPVYAEAYADLGNGLRRLGRFEEALEHYDKVLALKPNYAEVHNSRGGILKTLGRIEAARQAIETAVELAPKRVEYYASLAQVMRFAKGDHRLITMENLAGNISSLTRDEQIQLHFTLATALADLGQHQRSFRHLLDGNRLKRQQLSYDETAALGWFDRIRAVLTPELIRERQGFGHPSALPVFIVGMPRSGTTLVEQILASHPQVFGAGEVKFFQDALARLKSQEDERQPYPEIVPRLTGPRLSELGVGYLTGLRGLAPSASRITDKMPGNFVAVGLIHLALPNARIIHVRRDPIDTCLSCFSTQFAEELPFAYDLAELGRYYRGYAALMEHWRQVLPQGAMFEVQYEELVGDFESQARQLVAHCGLEWDAACLAFHATQRPVQTASAVQVRQPIYRSAIGRWRLYKAMLGPLLAALGIEASK